jgi:hypothetical protein
MAFNEEFDDITEEELEQIANETSVYSSDEEMFAEIERLNQENAE